MTSGSLFAGLGGFELGFERAGFKTLWSVEIEQQCRDLLAARFPHSKIHHDVRTFNPDEHECPDVITFGFPCQDLSIAGNRAGMKGERSGLFYEATRIISGFVRRGLRFAVAENVPGLLSSDGGRDFARVLGTLGQLGATDIAWTTLDCQWFGLAQRRKRVFIVADFGGECAEEVLALREGLCWDTAPSREAGKGVAAAVEGRAAGSCECVPLTANPIGGHHPRNDLDNETYLAFGGNNTAGPIEVATSLDTTGGFAANQGGNVVVAFDTTQITSKGNYSNPKPGDACHPLAESAHPPVIAFSSKDSGNDAQADISPTLRSMNFKDSHINGGGQAAVAFKPSHYTRDKDGAPAETTPPLSADADKGDQEAIIFQTRIARNGRGQPETICPAQGGASAGATSDMRPIVAQSGVRRFTPQSLTLGDFIDILAFYGDTNKTNPDQILPILQCLAGSEAVEARSFRVPASLQQKEILQSTVHGGEVGSGWPLESIGEKQRQDESPPPETKGSVREVRQIECEGRSPQGRGHEQQSPIEPGKDLPQLSQQNPSCQAILHTLRQTDEGSRLLRIALSAVQEVGRSVDGEGQPICPREERRGGELGANVQGLSQPSSRSRLLREVLHAAQTLWQLKTNLKLERSFGVGSTVRRLTPL